MAALNYCEFLHKAAQIGTGLFTKRRSQFSPELAKAGKGETGEVNNNANIKMQSGNRPRCK